MNDLAERDANIVSASKAGNPPAAIAKKFKLTRHVYNVLRVARQIEKAGGAALVTTQPDGALAAYDRMVLAIAEAKAVDDVMEIADQAEAMRAYAHRAKNKDAEIDAAEIRIRAERRLGEMIASAKEAGQIKEGKPHPNSASKAELPRVKLAEAGIDHKLSSRAQQLAKLPADDFAWHLSDWRRHAAEEGARVSVRLVRGDVQQTKAAARAVKEEILGRRIRALPDEKFGIIVGDPEWRFKPRSRITGMDRAADNHYPTSSLEALMARPVRNIAADDCILFLWATVPMLAEAFCVLDAWGFASFVRDPETGFLTPDKERARYVSSFAWWKHSEGGIGTGYWFRVDHELLLVATRGKPIAPMMGTQERSLLDIPASRVHSAKPDLPLEMIERMWPTLPKIELNRRGPAREGWQAWGNEAEVGTSSETPEPLGDSARGGEENRQLGTAEDSEQGAPSGGVATERAPSAASPCAPFAAEDPEIPAWMRRESNSLPAGNAGPHGDPDT